MYRCKNCINKVCEGRHTKIFPYIQGNYINMYILCTDCEKVEDNPCICRIPENEELDFFLLK